MPDVSESEAGPILAKILEEPRSSVPQVVSIASCTIADVNITIGTSRIYRAKKTSDHDIRYRDLKHLLCYGLVCAEYSESDDKFLDMGVPYRTQS